MIVGELLRRAAIRLREQWADGEEQEVRESYTEPDFVISFDLDKFRGDAFPTDSWSACAVEAEVDSFTGNTEILSAVGVFDVGTPVDENIVIGQMEGGFLQGLGYASMEQMAYDGTGRIRNNSFSDYLIPTAADVPKLKTLLPSLLCLLIFTKRTMMMIAARRRLPIFRMKLGGTSISWHTLSMYACVLFSLGGAHRSMMVRMVVRWYFTL